MDEDLKARLLARRAETESGYPEDYVDVPGMGKVRVRGLSRSEQLFAVKQGDVDMQGNVNMTRVEAIERRMLACALTDPVMTEAEVGQWQKFGGGGEIEPVMAKIQELSGMLPGAPKDVVKSFRDGSDAGV